MQIYRNPFNKEKIWLCKKKEKKRRKLARVFAWVKKAGKSWSQTKRTNTHSKFKISQTDREREGRGRESSIHSGKWRKEAPPPISRRYSPQSAPPRQASSSSSSRFYFSTREFPSHFNLGFKNS